MFQGLRVTLSAPFEWTARAIGFVCVCGWLGSTPVAAEETDVGAFRYRPSIGWTRGDHRVDLSLVSRYRWESWDARAPEADSLHGLRTRVGVRYAWKDTIALFGQIQDTHVFDLSNTSSGAGALYRQNTPGGDKRTADATRLRQLYLELAPAQGVKLRGGRQDINVGTLLKYDEANWKYLKFKRLSQRLVGTVGWTNGERSYDGVSAAVELDDHFVHLFAAEPTTGVFDIDGGYKRQKRVAFGGIDWTVKRNTWLDHTELGGFFIVYADDRDPADVAGLFGDIELYTFGASLLGVYPLGPGNLDLVLWGALQFGDYTDPSTGGAGELNHRAWALITEIGYQLPDLPLKPWLRLGVNAASGDRNRGDNDHGTFYNLLPTNHLYYGYADQFAFQNLVDLLAQLKLKPHKKVGIEFTVHHFWLTTSDDFRYFGSGAFNKGSLGYGRPTTRGSRDLGTELDLTVSYALHRHVSLLGGYAHHFGTKAMQTAPSTAENTEWAFMQVVLKY